MLLIVRSNMLLLSSLSSTTRKRSTVAHEGRDLPANTVTLGTLLVSTEESFSPELRLTEEDRAASIGDREASTGDRED
jgi:hypothetical protein